MTALGRNQSVTNERTKDLTPQTHTDFKHVADDGSIIQMIVWRVPEAVPPTAHGFKCRLVYVVEGVRVVGFDNERARVITATSTVKSVPTFFRLLINSSKISSPKWKNGGRHEYT
jgi:hypothetical protein